MLSHELLNLNSLNAMSIADQMEQNDQVFTHWAWSQTSLPSHILTHWQSEWPSLGFLRGSETGGFTTDVSRDMCVLWGRHSMTRHRCLWAARKQTIMGTGCVERGWNRDRGSLGDGVRGALRNTFLSNQVLLLGKEKPKEDERSVWANTNNQKAGEGNAAVALLWTKCLAPKSRYGSPNHNMMVFEDSAFGR